MPTGDDRAPSIEALVVARIGTTLVACVGASLAICIGASLIVCVARLHGSALGVKHGRSCGLVQVRDQEAERHAEASRLAGEIAAL